MTENFETFTKTTYDIAPTGSDPNDNATLGSGSWRMYSAVAGATAGADRFNGTTSARIRGIANFYMNFDKPNGAGTLTFYYARYATDAGLSIQVSYSTNGGSTWTNVGSAVSSTAVTTLTQATVVINQPGNIRIRFATSGGTSSRCNIDDISLTDYATPACTTPSAATGINFSNVTASALLGTIDNGANPNPSGFLVIRYTGNTAPSTPADGTTYSAANIATLNPGGVTDLQFIQSGTATSFSESGLNAGVTYKYAVYAYNNTSCTGGPKYSVVTTGSQATSSQAPVCTAPASQASTLGFSGVTTSAVTGTISGGAADGYLVLRSSGAAPTQPVDGTTYNSGNISSLGAGNVFVSGSAASFTESGLSANTNYTYYAFAFNNIGCTGGPVYNTATPLSASQYTYADTATALFGSSPTNTSFNVNWTAPAGGATGYYLDVALNSSFSSMVTGYNNLNVSNVTSYTVTGLTAGTTYYFRVRAYNAAGTGANSATAAFTVPCATPTAVATGLNFTNVTNTTFKINWSNTGNGTKRIVKINTVNAFSVTDGVETAASTAYTGGEQVVYSGTATSVTVNGLSPNTTYYVAVYEASCSGANILYNMAPLTGSQATANLQATILYPGDISVVGYDGNGTSCGGSARDEFWMVCFKDINSGTSFDITDNGWQRAILNKFGNTEGIYRYTYTGAATIPAGTIIKVLTDNTSSVETAMNSLYGANTWTVSALGSGSNAVAFNNTGDQFYVMQGGTWNNGTAGGHDATYTNGRFLYGFSSSTPGWAAFTGVDIGTQASVLYSGTTCLNTAPEQSGTNGAAWLTYSGPVSATDQYNWLLRLSNKTNWTVQTSCANTDAAIVTTFGGASGTTNYGTISITGSGTAAKWGGASSTDWTNCSNWETLVTPDSTSDVTIPATPVNQPQITSVVNVRNLTVNGTTTVGTGGTLNVKGNLVNNGTINASLGSVVLNGTAAQTVTGLTAENVTVNNANGITLASNATVGNTLTMTQGNINTGAFTLTLGTGTTQPGTLAYTSGLVSGKMQRWFAAATNSGNASGLFPLGTSGNNRSVLVEYSTAPTAGGTLTAQLVNTPMGSNISVSGNIVSACTGANGFAVTQTTANYWQIDAGNGLSGGNYDITLAAQGFSGANTCELTLLKRDQPGAWMESGTHVEPYTNNSILYLKRTNAAGWSDWGIAGSNATPLAIKLASFNVAKKQSSVLLNWSTAEELAGDRFELERSENGKDYAVLTAVKANGHASEYNYTDAQPAQGKNYYRLAMIEANGKKQYSSVRIADMGNDRTFSVVAFPNPVSDRLTLQAANKTATASVQLTDLTGKVLSQVQMTGDAVELDMSTVAPGIYLVRYTDGTHTALFKIVK